jgi:hypothetical protein
MRKKSGEKNGEGEKGEGKTGEGEKGKAKGFIFPSPFPLRRFFLRRFISAFFSHSFLKIYILK